MAVENYQGFYEVIVSNVGKVLEGNNAFKANSTFNTYVGMSKRKVGRVAGESVDMYRNGEIVKQFTGSLAWQEIATNGGWAEVPNDPRPEYAHLGPCLYNKDLERTWPLGDWEGAAKDAGL